MFTLRHAFQETGQCAKPTILYPTAGTGLALVTEINDRESTITCVVQLDVQWWDPFGTAWDDDADIATLWNTSPDGTASISAVAAVEAPEIIDDDYRYAPKSRTGYPASLSYTVRRKEKIKNEWQMEWFPWDTRKISLDFSLPPYPNGYIFGASHSVGTSCEVPSANPDICEAIEQPAGKQTLTYLTQPSSAVQDQVGTAWIVDSDLEWTVCHTDYNASKEGRLQCDYAPHVSVLSPLLQGVFSVRRNPWPATVDIIL